MRWGKYVLVLVGAVLIIACAFFIDSIFSNGNKTKTNVNVSIEESSEIISETESEESSEEDTETELATTEPVKVETTMYTTTLVNFREDSSTYSRVINTLKQNSEITVINYDKENDWSEVVLNGVSGYIYTDYISDVKTEIKTGTIMNVDENVMSDEFHYYGIWSGPGWHFTPEQIDDAWHYIVGTEHKYRTTKPHMELGTTRAWQKYLYETLVENNLGWFYKIACAQAMQESGFNPLNNASTDHGLFSFRETFWDSSYGDIYDYHANINAYVDRIKKYLIGVDSIEDVYLALSQHYNPTGQIHTKYVNDVLSHLKELWICD